MIQRLILLLALSDPGVLIGQERVDYARRDFFELRHELRTYYDDLMAIDPTLPEFAEGGAYSEFKRWEEYWSARIPWGKTFEDQASAADAAYQTLAAKMAAPKSNTDPWYEIGPTDRPNSGVMALGTQGSQPGIGPIRFLNICEYEADKALCGSEGGLFYRDMSSMPRWINAGSDAWPVGNCQYAVFHISNPEIWYAATSSFLKALGGILRRDPINGTWDIIADQSDLGFWNRIQKLQTDPDDENVLYAATSDGLFRTLNANDADPTWTKIILPTPTDAPYGAFTYVPWQFVYDLEVEPGNGQHLYVTVRFHGEDPGMAGHFVDYWKLLHSTDGGATWGEIPNTPSFPWVTGTTDSNAELLTIEVTEAAPSSLYVLFDALPPVGVVDYDNDKVFRTTNAVLGQWDPPLVSGFYNWYGAGHGFGVSPSDADLLAVANDDRYLVYDHGSIADYNADETNKNQYHVDVEDLTFHPISGDLWMADHGSLHLSTDNGANWEFIGEGLGVAQCYGFAPSYSEPGYIAIALNHDGNVLSDGNYFPGWQPAWRQLGGLDGQHPMIDPKEGRFVYWHHQNNGGYKMSADHGVTSTSLFPGSTGWDTHCVMDRLNPATFYTTNYLEVRRTLNRGGSAGTEFETISDFAALLSGIPSSDKGIWRLYTAYSNPEHVYAHIIIKFGQGIPDLQKLYRTTMARGPASLVKQSWEEVVLPQVENPLSPGTFVAYDFGPWIADLDFDPVDPHIVYFSYSTALGNTSSTTGQYMLIRMNYNIPMGAPGYQTDLTGTGTNALPNMGAGGTVIERGSNGGIYFATDMGVFYTNSEFISDGTGWVLLGGDLPHHGINGLMINYEVNKIRAAFGARGVWEHDLYCPSLLDAIESGIYGGHLFREVKNNISSTAIVPPGIGVEYRAGNEVALEPGFHAQAGSSFHAFIHGCDAPGNSFKNAILDDPSGDRTDDAPPSGSQLLVYPNPVSGGAFTIKLAAEGRCIEEIQVLDATGRVVAGNWRLEACDRAVMTFANDAPSGLFVAHVTVDDGSVLTGPLNRIR